MDVIVACVALVCLFPVLFCIAVAVYLEGGFSVFFSQTRLGLGGKNFQLLKFRKFGPDAGTTGLPVTLADDPRLTRVGRILEKTKLDELPQFWNVIKGDMSMVGPRPESLHFADCFVGSFRVLLEHKPGIFGPAQVLFRNESAYYRSDQDPEQIYRLVLFPTKASIDLLYYGSRTLLTDIAWIGRGAAAVVGLPRIGYQKHSVWPVENDLFIPKQAGLNLQFTSGVGMSSMTEEDHNGL
jgi:lipopolysaccharide/colanic/teichoic acid biosynthesis glycosyltransferase